ncbi:dpy30 domain-containing protein 2 [Lasius niger]|uniref:Dpy30 domain-containing protein 2 n=1 Tax=Lasius niger TaxID=67767 RepID=A0A0J7NSG5_LASNI|nr:dpy30 domain-containing protein 2 [Lasius niger]
MEISDDTVLEEQSEEDVHEQDEEKQLEERSIEEIEVIKEVKETEKSERDDEIDKSIATFLREKGLSENLIKTLINTGLTDEHVRLLKALNLNDDDIDNLRDLWRTKIEVSKSSDSIINSSTPDDSSSDGRAHLSPNSVYLRKVLSKPLIQALCEIVAKKPADPVEYLGHWLLHFKEVEDKQDFPIEQKEVEISSEDENHLNYDDT